MNTYLSAAGYHEFDGGPLEWPLMQLCRQCGQPKGNYKHVDGSTLPLPKSPNQTT